ncbi:hypothetical protein [Prosthecobacter sp.]|uniref:hypothetical protein n=1 Tax=Prosthecobacter sp. TaxID=1965333 RepID=UPI003783B1F4
MKLLMAAARVPASKIEAAQLRHWKLIEQFQRVLDEVSPQHQPHRSEYDPRRTLHQRDYFSLFLLGLFNPVITSMRGLCQASRLQRTQRSLGTLPLPGHAARKPGQLLGGAEPL